MFFKNHLFKVQSISTFFNFANLSVTLFILAVLSVISFQVLTSYFCFTQFCGAPHCLNFDEFRGTALLNILCCACVLYWKVSYAPHPTLYAETSDTSTKSHWVGSELLLVIHTRTRAVWQGLYIRKCILPLSLQPDLGMTSTRIYLIKIFISVF